MQEACIRVQEEFVRSFSLIDNSLKLMSDYNLQKIDKKDLNYIFFSIKRITS